MTVYRFRLRNDPIHRLKPTSEGPSTFEGFRSTSILALSPNTGRPTHQPSIGRSCPGIEPVSLTYDRMSVIIFPTTSRLVSTWFPQQGMLRVFGALALLTSGFWTAADSYGHNHARDTVQTRDKYWIFLDKRPDPSDVPLTAPVAPSYRADLRDRGIRPIVQSRWFHAISAVLSDSQRTSVENLPFVQRVAPVRRGQLKGPRVEAPVLMNLGTNRSSSTPLDLGPSRGPLSRINAVAPMTRGLDGRGVRVGFLDAHFRGLRHGAFDGLRQDNRLVALRSFTEGTQKGNHGSAVTSVTVGNARGSLVGPARGAELLGATTEYTPFERNVEEDYFVSGLEWLHRWGADVVNVSIGYTTFDEGEKSYTPDDLDGDTGITTRAVDRAANLGVTVVVSAGNSGCSSPDSCWYYVNTPADADSAITVGAITPDSTLASFSSRGPTADGRTKPDVVVQGTNVTAAWDDHGFAQVNGTSFASPQVTGVIALMLQVNPTLSPIEVRNILRQTASQNEAPNNKMGWGIVNADAAIRAAERQARATPPSSLIVEAPYPNSGTNTLTIPVRTPAHTQSVHVSLSSRLGQEVLSRTIFVRPGPNRLTLSLPSLPPGLYVYRVQGRHSVKRGTITMSR